MQKTCQRAEEKLPSAARNKKHESAARRGNHKEHIIHMDSAQKTAIRQDYQRHESDTGSVEVQVALLSKRISDLTRHLQANKQDHNSRRGLIVMVSKRRRLLDYLARTDIARYRELVKRLGLRR